MSEDRLTNFKNTAKEFCDKIKDFKEIIEVGIVGSTAGKSNYPGDLDIFVILANFSHKEHISKLYRQIWGGKHIPMDIFFLDRQFKDLGRLCFRKECPTSSIDCDVPGCGKIKYVRKIDDFVFDKKQLLTSPVEILHSKENLFLNKIEKENIKEIKEYEKLKDIKIDCIKCGKEFIFSIGEQKSYEKRGFSLPKRCEDCREKRFFGGELT